MGKESDCINIGGNLASELSAEGKSGNSDLRERHDTNRVPLQNVIPLEEPFSILVEPTNLCNFKCKFCPYGDKQNMKKLKKDYLDFDLFVKIIDDISEFENPIKALHLYHFGEPLLHPRLAEMIRYIKKAKCAKRVTIMTNGYLLTPKRVLPIIEAGIDYIHISVNGLSSKQFKTFAGVNIDFKRYIRNIEFLYQNRGNCKISIKIMENMLNEHDEKYFYDLFSPIADILTVDKIFDAWSGNDFVIQDKENLRMEESNILKKKKGRKVCPLIFTSMIVNSNGTVSLCCEDWKRQNIIGDVKKESLKDIWNSKKLFDIQMQHLTETRYANDFCRKCNKPDIDVNDDNFDSFREELAKKLRKNRIHDISKNETELTEKVC